MTIRRAVVTLQRVYGNLYPLGEWNLKDQCMLLSGIRPQISNLACSLPFSVARELASPLTTAIYLI